MSVSVCVPVCSVGLYNVGLRYISPELYVQSSSISLHITYGRGSVLIWWRCDTLCTSGNTVTPCLYIMDRNRRREEDVNSR